MANVILKGNALARLRQKFGAEFPDPKEQDGRVWQQWFKAQRDQQQSEMRDRRLHWSRHRNFRVGNQWIASRDGRTWKEPGAERNALRPVDNHIGPALAFRHGVIAEQTPGFRHDLLSTTIRAREEAEAQQAVAEHFFHKLKAERTFRDAVWHAQTDGVCFIQVWFDPLAGSYRKNMIQVMEDDERYMGLVAQGYEVDQTTGAVLLPLSESGDKIMKPGTEVGEVAEGDLANRIVLAHDTMVDPEARMLNGEGSDAAKWFLIRRPRDLRAARIETGKEDLQAETYDSSMDALDFSTENVWQNRGLPPYPGQKRRFKESVYDYTVFIAPDGKDLPNGLWRRIIGETIVDTGDELPGGIIPFARFTDGSPDPSFYPRPTMADWVGDQVSINQIQATIMQHGRIMGIGRLMALKGTIVTETYNSVVGSLLEYQGIKPDQLPALRSSADLWDLLQFKIKKLEDKTGHNDLARGQVLGQAGGGMQDVSGRAVLGAREMLERTFGPMVQATAEGASEWAEIVVKYAAWMFGDTPRQIENVGGRGDLAKLVTKEQLEGECHIYCDAATLMPMPAQLRQEQLDNFRKEGLISIQDWAKRSPYAITRDVQMGDIDHWQRAQWVNSVLEENWRTFAGVPEGMDEAPQPVQPDPMDQQLPGEPTDLTQEPGAPTNDITTSPAAPSAPSGTY